MKAFEILIVLMFILSGLPETSFAAPMKTTIDPTEMSVGARPFGMGKAFIALSDDCNSIFLNPSGLARTAPWQATSMYASLLGEINYSMIGFSHSLGSEALGIGYLRADVGDSAIISHRDPNTGRIVDTGEGTIGYVSSVLLLSYGGELRRWIDLDLLNDFDLGINAKIFNQSLTGGSVETYATGFDADLGGKWRPSPWLSFGFFGSNILTPTQGGVLRWTSDLEESIPSLWKVGVAAKLLGWDAPWQFSENELYADLDIEISEKRNRPQLNHLGFEFWPIEYLALRLGIDQDAVIYSENITVDNNLTAGIGFYYQGIEFDYAFHQFGSLSENNTHYFSLSFGIERKKATPPPMLPEVVEKPKDKYIDSLYPASGSIIYADRFFVSGEVEREVTRVQIGDTTAEAVDGKYAFFVPVPTLGKNKFELAAFNEVGRRLDGAEIKILRLPGFTDVPDGYWARQAIGGLAMIGLVQGYKDGTFHPDGNITRAELTTMLVRAKGEKLPLVTEKKVFNDVTSGHWAAAYIKAGVSGRLVKGYPDGTFRPGENINRAEGTVVVARFDGLVEPEDIYEKPFGDIPANHWAIKMITAAKDKGILDYLKDKDFEAKKNIARAEAVEMLSKTTFASGKIDDLLDFSTGY